MIVHLFQQEKFTVPFIKFLNKNFDIEENMFLIYGDNNAYKKDDVEQYKNIEYINGKRDIVKLLKKIYIAEKIILHSLFIPNWILVVLSLNKRLLNKCNWVIWGGDLYDYKFRDINLKSNIRELLRRYIIKNIGGFITHIKGDYELAKLWYGAKGEYFYSFMYPSNVYKEYDLSNIKKDSDCLCIQIGNSADPTNNHIEILNKLKCYCEKNIRIICPISYGNVEYRKKVIKEGIRLFGDKFNPITDFMPFEEYLEMLAKVDVAIFNHQRQQAVGNITTLLGLGKKVYIRDDITTWDFCREHGLKVYKSNDDNLDIYDTMTNEEQEQNRNNVREDFSTENLKVCWENIFKAR
ncbi:TDP-N-acetylfucosamine:lipid II N-acetylfucosaminyltransferase [Clostridium gasigenes]|uniref:TDP-N-acetylfucosamine:lipid II N-acetylfucosaminyltransferase n=1 Tax=Clostridium gasigenes TaxID=94869 RepID=UPI001C0CD365|nr:TDP-N-acetylfucosamine:lipid II N-acetylfucosaminyltransferase [Clostridium gasigenes]MBU3134093.1 TDP-N-acetylfucosamine:lipid II N-acetylfucosaminyltransferase [Clostridium gasigenes]